MALAVQRDGLPHPPAVPARLPRADVPFGFVELGAVELVVPDELPGLARGRGWKLIRGFLGHRTLGSQEHKRKGKHLVVDFMVPVLSGFVS